MLTLLSFITNVTAQIYQVQVAAFTEEIEPSFFAYAGYNNVYAKKDYNNFVRYTLGEFFTRRAANEALEAAIRRGLDHAYINTLDQPLFAYAGDSYKLPLIMIPEKEQSYIRAVQFTAANLSLSNELMTSLEEALSIMKAHPELKLRIIGHTDDIGEKIDNKVISKKRARLIQNFLLANGIPAYRLKMKVSEHSSPAVYFKGKGLPKNRDFNRRIIMALVDLKDEIVDDDFVRNNEETQTLSSMSINSFSELIKHLKIS